MTMCQGYLFMELSIDDLCSSVLHTPALSCTAEVSCSHAQSLHQQPADTPALYTADQPSNTYLWSGLSQLKLLVSMMLVSLALLGKKRARSVARMQCFMFPSTCLYSSGPSLLNILWCS